LSLSHEGPGGGGGGVSRTEGEESKVFPLVVVRVLVLQVSYCLFKSMCRVCPSIGTDAESYRMASVLPHLKSSPASASIRCDSEE
jgi:hypothetical protein